MDFGLIGGANPRDRFVGGPMSFDAFEPARWAMGDTVRLAERLDLIRMEPRADLSSTRFALASEGTEYAVLQPDVSASFTVTVAPGAYAVEWIDVDRRGTERGEPVSVGAGAPPSFDSPFAPGPAVLVLRRV
jgi:hypothetical protein